MTQYRTSQPTHLHKYTPPFTPLYRAEFLFNWFLLKTNQQRTVWGFRKCILLLHFVRSNLRFHLGKIVHICMLSDVLRCVGEKFYCFHSDGFSLCCVRRHENECCWVLEGNPCHFKFILKDSVCPMFGLNFYRINFSSDPYQTLHVRVGLSYRNS